MNDGDKSLVCAEKVLVDAADRHMQGIVPLYYEMRKAAPQVISNQSIYEGMTTAFSGGNIGPISNNITKIWNSANPDVDVVKWLCYKTNETIDYAKTLYKSIAPRVVTRRISAATNCKLPHFFIYAKDKTPDQVLPASNSPVDRLLNIVPKHRFNFNAKTGGKFDFHMLMNNPNLIRTPNVDLIISEYTNQTSKINPNLFSDDEEDKAAYPLKMLREHMFSLATNQNYVVDAIIYGIFHLRNTRHKNVFWGAFGDIVLSNLKSNLAKQCDSMTLCSRCYNRFSPIDAYAQCPVCGTKNGNVRTAFCIDCGEEFTVDSRNTTKVRCSRCQRVADRENTSDRVRKFRSL